MLVVQVLLWVGLGYLGGQLAVQKGYSPTKGIILGLLCGPIALLIAWLALPKTELAFEQEAFEKELAQSPKIANCPNCGRQIAFGSTICPECDYLIKKK